MYRDNWDVRRAFEKKLKELIRAELSPCQVWTVSVTAHPACAMTGWMSAMRYPTDGTTTAWEAHLPAKVPEKNLFPSERMLHFMGQAPLPLKRAKPRDWEEMATAFGKKLAEENRE